MWRSSAAAFPARSKAINLLRHGGPCATLIERVARIARGVACSTVHPDHLLNVRAGNMSALPDDPNHFVRWLAARTGAEGRSFAARADYGRYLTKLLRDAQARHRGGWMVTGEADDSLTRRGEFTP